MRPTHSGKLILVVSLCIASYAARAGERDALFAKAQPSIAVITSPVGVGSGFVLTMDGKRYLITNEHVLRSGHPMKARLLNGTELKYTTLEMGQERDIVRLLLDDSEVPSLIISKKEPTIGDDIGVFGNSDGDGVATSLAGEIRGVGPDLIEVDAKFVQGNSGSPILNSVGEVVGVATHVKMEVDPEDWIKRDTRFAKVRRFGVRLNGVKWHGMSFKDYHTRTDMLADIQTYCQDLFALKYTDGYYDQMTGLCSYTYDGENHRYRHAKALCRNLDNIVEIFNPARRHATRVLQNAEVAVHSSQGLDRADAKRQIKFDQLLLQKKSQQHKRAYEKLFSEPRKALVRNDWITKRMKAEARYWVDVLNAVEKN